MRGAVRCLRRSGGALRHAPAWAGYLGAGCEGALAALLGAGSEVREGPGFGLGAAGGCALRSEADGSLRAWTETSPDAGASVRLDPTSGAAALETDPFGLHGAYVARVAGAVWFASDPRLLARLGGAAPALAPGAIHGYLCLSHVPAPLAALAGVEALAAGERRVVSPSGARRTTSAAWREAEPAALGEAEAAARLLRLLREAVERRLGGERDASVFLSGGLDSSLVAALLAEAGSRVHLFTLDFGPPFDAELPWARRVAAHLGRPLHLVPADPARIRRALPAAAAALQQPFGDPVTVPLYLLGEAAAGCASLAFNGEGGDQLFGGWANKPLVAAETQRPPGYSRAEAYLGTYHRFYGWAERFYTPRALALTAASDPAGWVRPALDADGFRSLLHRLRAANLWLKGAGNIAPRSVQLAVCHGLRPRSPFFDRELARWSFSLPPGLLLRGACEKHLLKRAAERLLPPEVVWREKRGMGVPATEWLLGPLRGEAARRLSCSRLRAAGWLRPEAVRALRRGEDVPSEFRRRRLGERLWALLMLHAWWDAQQPRPDWPTSAWRSGH